MARERIILITGATEGLGRRVAEKLAAPGVHLLIHGRDRARGHDVVAAIARRGGSARFIAADFASLAEVRTLAASVQADYAALDVLVNNAGIAKVGSARSVGADGFELHFTVNYLATFLLTHLLRPLLAAHATVVNVVSAGQSRIDFADVMLERGYDGMRAYGQSKLAQVMFTFDVAQAFAVTGRTASCLHPSTFMDTRMVRDAGITPVSSVDTGAEALVALVNAPAGTSGRYFDVRREARAHAQAYDLEARRRLRTLSATLTGLPVDVHPL